MYKYINIKGSFLSCIESWALYQVTKIYSYLIYKSRKIFDIFGRFMICNKLFQR